jgi:hypothetical protein
MAVVSKLARDVPDDRLMAAIGGAARDRRHWPQKNSQAIGTKDKKLQIFVAGEPPRRISRA